MTYYDVVKADSLQKLKEIVGRKTAAGLTPLGVASFIHIRNKLNKRTAVYYQSVGLVGYGPLYNLNRQTK